MTSRTISIGYVARVEGESALLLTMDGDRVTDVKLKIFEPPRFFEAFLRGRRADEAPDVTARICGICPVAYQMSAVHAMEKAAGVTVPAHVRALRRLLYCGEWIESHALHVFLLHAPDFLGYPSAIAMAQDHPDWVTRGLSLKKAGNAIISLLGGREIHPVNVRLGGFHKIPDPAAFRDLLPMLAQARADAVATVDWLSRFPFPAGERDYEFVALRHPREYPMSEGRIASTGGLDVDAEGFEAAIEESQVPYTNALHARIRGRGAYLCGPLARFALNHDVLPADCQDAARKAGIAGGTRNPYKAILVRAVEILFALGEAAAIITRMTGEGPPHVDARPAGQRGHAATEAPRGLLYHRYDVGADGLIADARIIPPTSQNQLSIEDDLRLAMPAWAREPDDVLQARCEQAIRNHDPCISCATHFLTIRRQAGEDGDGVGGVP